MKKTLPTVGVRSEKNAVEKTAEDLKHSKRMYESEK